MEELLTVSRAVYISNFENVAQSHFQAKVFVHSKVFIFNVLSETVKCSV